MKSTITFHSFIYLNKTLGLKGSTSQGPKYYPVLYQGPESTIPSSKFPESIPQDKLHMVYQTKRHPPPWHRKAKTSRNPKMPQKYALRHTSGFKQFITNYNPCYTRKSNYIFQQDSLQSSLKA